MKTTLLSIALLFFGFSGFGQNYIADGSNAGRTTTDKVVQPKINTATEAPAKASLSVFAPESIVDTTRRAEDIDVSMIIGKVSGQSQEVVQSLNNAAVPNMANPEDDAAVEEAVAAAKADMATAAVVTKTNIEVKAGLKAADYKAMVKEHTNYLKTAPKDADVYMARAKALVALKDFKGAIKDFNAVIDIKPTDGDAFYNRGMAKMNIGDFQGGINDMTKVLKLKPGDTEAYFNRAMCKMYLDQTNSAIMDFTVVIKLDPNNADAYLHRGILKFDNEDWKGACRDWSVIAGHDERAAKAIKKYCLD